jgi:hypothetical protein
MRLFIVEAGYIEEDEANPLSGASETIQVDTELGEEDALSQAQEWAREKWPGKHITVFITSELPVPVGEPDPVVPPTPEETEGVERTLREIIAEKENELESLKDQRLSCNHSFGDSSQKLGGEKGLYIWTRECSKCGHQEKTEKYATVVVPVW